MLLFNLRGIASVLKEPILKNSLWGEDLHVLPGSAHLNGEEKLMNHTQFHMFRS